MQYHGYGDVVVEQLFLTDGVLSPLQLKPSR